MTIFPDKIAKRSLLLKGRDDQSYPETEDYHKIKNKIIEENNPPVKEKEIRGLRAMKQSLNLVIKKNKSTRI